MRFVGIRIPEDMVEAADAVATEHDTDRSQLIRDALARYLDDMGVAA